MVQSMLSNLAILLIGHLLMSKLMDYRGRFSNRAVSVCIVLLFSGVIISMFYLPIHINGYKFDLRLIPLIFLAIFRGWKVSVSTLLIVCTWRYFMGGVGTLPGILAGMIGPTLFVIIFYALKKNFKFENNIEKVFIITVCWFISDFPIVYIVPNGWEVFKTIFLIRYVSFLLVAFIYYSLVKSEYNKEDLKKQLESMAWHDQLTGLLNRRKFLEIVENKLDDSVTDQYIAMIDIDYFKKINDIYGHAAGDSVLSQFSSLLLEEKSENMIVARYGGEEFIVYLEAADPDEAILTLEVLQQRIRKTTFKIDSYCWINISISIGLAKREPNVSLKAVINEVDQHLYMAKESGRDRLNSPYNQLSLHGSSSSKS